MKTMHSKTSSRTLAGRLAVLALGTWLAFCLSACAPDRWKHADIQEINAEGTVAQEWVDVEIVAWPNSFANMADWIRFKTREGKEITLRGQKLRVLYR